MPIKSKICKGCGASFVPEKKNQEYCNECLKKIEKEQENEN